MSEIHDSLDNRNISIKNVGISDYVIPFTFVDNNIEYNTIATIKAGVELDKYTKGAHLSRIPISIDEMIANKKLSVKDFYEIIKKMSSNVGVNNANIKLNFKIVLSFKTPKSNVMTNMFSDIELYYNYKDNKIYNNYVSVSGNVAMLCPNSKMKSKYGAHSQKCLIKITLYDDVKDLCIYDIYKVLCNSGSAPVYGIIRSEDEVFLTQKAYDNPKFSEDAVRDLIISIKEKYKENKVVVNLINYESIHQHNVFCEGEY